MNLELLARLVTRLVRKISPLSEPLKIYTDGSHKGKWGSWAFVVVKNGEVLHEASGRARKTNSHRMEFQAAIEALSYLPADCRAFFYTDSRILINFMTQKNKRPAVNLDQMEVLQNLAVKHKICWNWIKGHSGSVYNERCDELCKLAREVSPPHEFR